MGTVFMESRLTEIASRLTAIEGIVGVALGGSRARGEAHPDSDVDLGLYYRSPLDVTGLRELAAVLGTGREGQPPELTEVGGWGPWVDGGGWLSIDGVDVDWIYRDVDRVAGSVADARAGRLSFGFQVGHAFGFTSVAYAGELASGVLLRDPAGELATLRAGLDPYPAALRDAVIAGLWEADFLLGAIRKSAERGDTATVAGTLFRVVMWCAHVVCAQGGRWVINEKGLVEAAGRLPGAPAEFTRRAQMILAELGTDPERLTAGVQSAAELVAAVRDS